MFLIPKHEPPPDPAPKPTAKTKGKYQYQNCMNKWRKQYK